MPSPHLRPLGVFLALCLLLNGLSAQAQSGPTLASLQIELWPEFDQPTTLVILDGRLEASVILPTEVTLRIPAGAGQPHAVAIRDANGELLNAPYTTTPLGEEVAIVLQADSAEFRVEYYDPALTVQGNNRAYTFHWLADYAIQAVAVRVQQPANAHNLRLEPSFVSAGAGEYGLDYHVATLGALAAGQNLTINLAYQKSTSTLSAEAMGVEAPSTADASSQTMAALSPWLVLGLSAGTLLLMGGVIWYVRSGSRPRARKPASHSTPAHRRRASAPRAVVPSQLAPSPDARFCTQCGQRAETSDQFCRTCGTQLRFDR